MQIYLKWSHDHGNNRYLFFFGQLTSESSVVCNFKFSRLYEFVVPVSWNRILPHIALGSVLPAEGRMLSFLTQQENGPVGFLCLAEWWMGTGRHTEQAPVRPEVAQIAQPFLPISSSTVTFRAARGESDSRAPRPGIECISDSANLPHMATVS